MEIHVIDGEDDALGVDRGADLVQLLARVIGGDQMLAPILDPFYRALGFFGRDADQNVFGINFSANTEAAAHVRTREREPALGGMPSMRDSSS